MLRMETMLKDFEMVYIDNNERVIAYDANQAWHAFVNTHPEVDTIGLSCIELWGCYEFIPV